MRGKALVVVAVLLGVAVVVMINSRFSSLEKQAHPPLQTFYLATADIYPGTTLRSVVRGKHPLVKEVKQIPRAFARAQPDLLDDQEYAWARDKTVQRPVRAGEFLRMSDLQPLSASEVRARMPEGTVAAAINVSQETAVGYLVAPGDIVDVYLVTTVQDPKTPGGVKAVSRRIGEDLKVFGIDNVIEPEDGTVMRPRGKPYRCVTIASTPKNIEDLIEARELGRLTLVLKARPEAR